MRWRVELEPEKPSTALSALSALLACGADPQAVQWCDGRGAQAELFGGLFHEAPCPPPEAEAGRALRALPRGFTELAQAVVQHACADRFQALHAHALALARDPRVWQDALDPSRLALERLAREVRREIHKMHAFVRFRPIEDHEGTRHVAWFEPEHHTVRAAAPFFARRFAAMRWSILTPHLCVHWDGERLRAAPGVDRAMAPAPDAGEALWLDYYRSIFNPSRLKTAAMLREMPRRYWRNLPEAQAITQLIQEAPQRSARMLAQVSESLRRPAISTPYSPSPTPRSAQERLDQLASRARHCSECPHASAATQMVWGEGRVGAALMVVGEQPGDQEDLAGQPFVGPAGQLLREAFSVLGWPLERLYLTNAVKHFRFEPRGKRRIHKTPAQAAVQACGQWLEAEIRLVQPQAVLALGATAASSLMGRPVAVNASAGQCLRREDGLPVWVAHHPAAVLRRAQSGAPGFGEWVEQLRGAWG